jgi:hypothetical protein
MKTEIKEISDDQNTIKTSDGSMHKFEKKQFYSSICADCSFYTYHCDALHIPCMEDERKDNKSGYFQLKQ